MLADRLKLVREKEGMTQIEAAQACEISLSTWRKWEQGRFEPNGGAIKKICLTLNCSADYLLGYSDSFNSEVQKSVRLEAYIDKLKEIYDSEEKQISEVERKFNLLSESDQRLVENLIDRLMRGE